METMHFHIAQTGLFLRELCFTFYDLGGPDEQFGTHEKLLWGAIHYLAIFVPYTILFYNSY